MLNNRKIDLMAPAGSYESLNAAIKAGANSVYFGVGKLNMRSRSAQKFDLDDLQNISDICTEHGVKSYLALNTIVYDDELQTMRDMCDAAKAANISAVIAADISAVSYARSIDLEVHMSTQANISNIEAVRFYSNFADVIVLARELELEKIQEIVHQIQQENITGPHGDWVQIELFVHGALCVSVSGKCYMSLGTFNRSANRGDCVQTCRRKYRVIDDSTGDELVVDNQYVMSPKDICTVGYMDKLIQAGASVFKIEGRGRSADYVYKVTKAYREAIDAALDGSFSQEKADDWIRELESVFNRGFWHGGYYLGHTLGEWSGAYGSQATKQKQYIGYVKNYFEKSKIVNVIMETGDVKVGDTVMVTGNTTGFAETTIETLFANDTPAQSAKKGDDITFNFAEKLRKNDKVYVLRDRLALQTEEGYDRPKS